MAYRKGEKVEPGIWKLADRDLSLAEVHMTDPRTHKHIRLRKTIHRKDLAKEWRQSCKVDVLRSETRRVGKKLPNRPFPVFAEEYLENWSKLEKKLSSYERDQISVNHLKAHFGKKPILEIERRDVERYVAGRRASVSSATTNRELCCLKNMLRKALDWGYIENNPAWGVKQAKESPPEFDFLTEKESAKFVGCCLQHLKTFLVLALNTGMRKGELFSLEWRDIQFEKGMNGIITVRDTKNSETRYIPMNRRIREAIQAHPKRIINGGRCPFVLSNESGKPYRDLRN